MRFTSIAGISNLTHQCNQAIEIPIKWDTALPSGCPVASRPSATPWPATSSSVLAARPSFTLHPCLLPSAQAERLVAAPGTTVRRRSEIFAAAAVVESRAVGAALSVLGDTERFFTRSMWRLVATAVQGAIRRNSPSQQKESDAWLARTRSHPGLHPIPRHVCLAVRTMAETAVRRAQQRMEALWPDCAHAAVLPGGVEMCGMGVEAALGARQGQQVSVELRLHRRLLHKGGICTVLPEFNWKVSVSSCASACLGVCGHPRVPRALLCAFSCALPCALLCALPCFRTLSRGLSRAAAPPDACRSRCALHEPGRLPSLPSPLHLPCVARTCLRSVRLAWTSASRLSRPLKALVNRGGTPPPASLLRVRQTARMVASSHA